jgi:hypothetical protein
MCSVAICQAMPVGLQYQIIFSQQFVTCTLVLNTKSSGVSYKLPRVGVRVCKYEKFFVRALAVSCALRAPGSALRAQSSLTSLCRPR